MPRQPQQQLYWRGTVFNRVEGRRWVRVEPPSEQVIYPKQRIIQTIYPEPGPSRILPSLDRPAALTLPRSRRAADGVYEFMGRPGRRLTYTAESVSAATVAVAGDIRRSFYLSVPENLPPRIRHLASDIRRLGTSDAGRLEQLENYFRNGGFRYSRTGLPTGEQALEQFLFDKKQGHCEFFAASFALVLRTAGVPARLVGGYLGGEYNDLGGYYLVSEEMAHVWVEAFIAGRGWVRVDPSSFAENAGAVWGNTPKRSLSHRIRLIFDSLDHTWNSAVISYDFERQITVALTAGKRLQGVEVQTVLRSAMRYLMVAAVVVGGYLILRYRKRLFPTIEERLLRAFYRRVRLDCSVTVERGRVGLFELADLTQNPQVRLFADVYASAVYRDRKLTDDEYVRLKQMVREGFKDAAG
jgi:transglutaminase-like putative cysteine protease